MLSFVACRAEEVYLLEDSTNAPLKFPAHRRSIQMVMDSYQEFKSACQEGTCLDHIFVLRFGGLEQDCPACGCRSQFSQVLKRRAYVCEACGYAMYPCLGTPFSKLRTPLVSWFFAIHLMVAGSKDLAKELRDKLHLPSAAAEHIEQALRTFVPLTENGASFAGWLQSINAFVEAHLVQPLNSNYSDISQHRQRSYNTTWLHLSADAVRHMLSATNFGLLPLGSIIVGAALATGLTFIINNWTDTTTKDEVFDPLLWHRAPSPSMTLAAVEEDLKAAKAVVESVAKAPKSTQGMTEPDVLVPGAPGEILTFGPIKVQRHIVEKILEASRIVGVDPSLLMAVADKESSFKTSVKALTSSATGLFQFIEQTWLGVVEEFGDLYGLETEKMAIVRSNNGYTVADSKERARILGLRRDPYLSALMAGEMLKRDTLRIQDRLGRTLTGGEIYLLHFLGPGDAKTFIDSFENHPGAHAARKFPGAARANKSIFYDKDGPRSISEVSKEFERMIATRLERYREVRNLRAMATPINETRQ
ncbi:transglycosylase SLT domain-containing protein [Microvirga sp. 0TCS3.31]